MGRNLRRVAVSLCSLALIAALPAMAWGLSDGKRASHGAAFLVTKQLPDGSIPAFSPIGSTADAVLAFVASGSGGSAMKAAIGYLQAQTAAGNVSGPGLRAKVVLALVAAAKDPLHFGGHNLVTEIKSTFGPDGRFGTEPVLDDALDVLALRAAGASPAKRASRGCGTRSAPTAAGRSTSRTTPRTTTRTATTETSDFFDSDSNTTSYVVQALEATGRPGWSADPFAYFGTVRDPGHGGWSYSASFIATDANSTALVLQAYAAAGDTVPSGGLRRFAAAARVRRVGVHVETAARRATPTWAPRSRAIPAVLQPRCRSHRAREEGRARRARVLSGNGTCD